MLPLTLLSIFVFFSESNAAPALRARSSISESSWRKPNVTQSLADLVDIASAALTKAVDGVNTLNQFDGMSLPVSGQTYEFVATLYTEMAQFDMITNQTRYEDVLQQSFSRTQQTRPNFADEQSYGYAALQAYFAYHNSTFLQYAIQSWSFGRSYTLSQAGTVTGKNFTALGACNGTTMAGGTSWSVDGSGIAADDNTDVGRRKTTTASDPSVAAQSTGYFMLLSALLAEATSNPTYLDAATESANFIHSHLYDSNGLVLQVVSADQNDSCQVLDDSLNTPNSGLFIEGLAVLVSQTQDASMQTLLNDLISNVLSNPTWQTTGGIIASGGSFILFNHFYTGKNGESIIVRALTAAYVRNVTTPAIRKSLRDYVSVQLNAVLDLATNGDNIYGIQWTDYRTSPLLNTAYLIASDANATASSTSPSSTQSPTPSKTPAAATIAGATIGTVLTVAIGVGIYLIIRHRARERQLLAPEPIPAAYPSVAPPADFSFIPRLYAVAEKSRLPPRHVPQISDATFPSTSTGSNSLPGTVHTAAVAARRDSRVLGEEPPPEYVALGR
ncbi:hypothetical protein DFH08DRAFT_1078428 [Mycena albidolilacea]|uniref:Glycoside hydrolase family 76 protein n=1 Tax=Mycena albidolilacea TaxID=1033008 RepID=A0AAD7EUV2_9AGAR|nr:hypothetical protein DFH08DRAFT_1078428 [Mycena albidolilacea]